MSTLDLETDYQTLRTVKCRIQMYFSLYPNIELVKFQSTVSFYHGLSQFVHSFRNKFWNTVIPLSDNVILSF